MNKLRPFQEDDVEFLALRRKAICGDEQGLGKTVVGASCLYLLRPEEKECVLIVCSKTTMIQWIEELDKWCPDHPEIEIMRGPAAQRKRTWARANWIVVTHEAVRQDINIVASYQWDVLIVDKASKIGRNRKTQLFKAFRKLTDIPIIWFLDGFPSRRGPQDLWGLLHILKPRIFRSYWKFESTFCEVYYGEFGREILGPKNTEALKNLLSQYMIRHIVDEVAPEMPKQVRQYLDVELESEQVKVYSQLADEMLAELESGQLIVAQTILTQYIKLRQLLACPKVVDDSLGYGAAINAVVEEILEQPDPHAAIFCSFKTALYYYREYLEMRIKGTPVYIIHGGMKPKDVHRLVNECKDNRGILLATISFSEGYNLETAQYSYTISPEWDPETNIEAERRLRRLTSKKTIFTKYVRHRYTIEDEVYYTNEVKIKDVRSFMALPRNALKSLEVRPTKTS